MTVENGTTETGSNPAPQVKPKGNQLEGKRSDALTTRQAADIFKGSLLGDTDIGKSNDKTSTQKTDKTATKSDAKKPQGQSNAEDQNTPEGEDNEVDLDNEEDGDPAAEDSEADEVDGSDGEEPEDTDNGEDLHTVIVDGKDHQVTYDELVSGYQRQADYTKKTIELATQRKALEAEKHSIADLPQVKEVYQKETTRFAQNAGLIMVAFEKGFMPQAPSEELRNSDPTSYILQKEKFTEAKQFMGALQQEISGFQAKAEDEHQKAVQTGRQQLFQRQPELQKPEIRGKLQSYVIGLGFTPDQLKREANPRLFELALKAMKWDDMLAKSKTQRAESPRPKVLKQTTARDDVDTVTNRKNSQSQERHKNKRSVRSASEHIAQKIINSRRSSQ